MTLEECVKEVINEKFKSGDYFDSHAVIIEMIRNQKWHEVYMQNFPHNSSIAQYHGLIAQKIREQNVKPADFNIVSHTIYGTLEKNHLWQKV